MPPQAAARQILGSIELFSRVVLRLPLRGYQLEPLRQVIDSVLRQEGREFLLVFPRQSGKNEAAAQLLVYLLNLLQRTGGNMVFAAEADGLGRGIQRLEARLENSWNRGQWGKGGSPRRRTLGNSAVIFTSTNPQAASRGETAHWLLIIDELQEQDPAHIEAVFQPMRAANNATFVGMGTVKSRDDALWRLRERLQAAERQDGVRRLFLVSPEQVCAENPAYRRFLAGKVAQLGRRHPIVAAEYFLEPMDGDGGMFPPRRRALMRGSHPRQHAPQEPGIYLAAVDVGGQDEASTDRLAALNNPGRDFTAAHIFQLIPPEGDSPEPPLPRYRALDVFTDHGSRHFQESAGNPSLVSRLLAWLRMWGVSHLFIDSSGVGEGIADWLAAALGRGMVTGFSFAAAGRKAALGSAFISLIETGRFHYWQADESDRDASLFWQQAARCGCQLPPGGQFDRHLRWGVPAGAAAEDGSGPLHDDRLLSAALIALADPLYRQGRFIAGGGSAVVITPSDPLREMRF